MDKPRKDEREDPSDTGDSLQALDLFLDSISELSNQNADRNQFYATLVSKLPQIAGGTRAMLLARFSGRLNLAYYGPKKLDELGIDRQTISSICEQIEANVRGDLATRFLKSFVTDTQEHFVAVCHPEGQPQLFFAFSRNGNSSTNEQAIYSDLVEEIANLIAQFEERLLMRAQQTRLSEIQRLTNMLLNMTNSNNYRKMAFNLVNDLAQFVQADRVCLFELNGRFTACSGVASVSRKSKIIRTLGSLSRFVGRKNTSLAYFENAVQIDNPHLRSRLEKSLEINNAKAMFANLLERDGRRLGVITIEYLGESEADWIDLNRRIESALDLCVPVFAKTKQIHSIPFLGLGSWIFETVFGRPVRTVLVTAALAGLFFFLFVFSTTTLSDFEIKARGHLFPSDTRDVFATANGTVEEVFVAEGKLVQVGDRIARLHSNDLKVKITKAQGDLDEANQQLSVLRLSDITEIDSDRSENIEAKRARIASEIKRQEIRIATIIETLNLLEVHKSSLNIASPINGQVTTRKVETTLPNRPVSLGDPLLQISDLQSEWEILLDVDEQKISYVIQSYEEAEAKGAENNVVVRLRFASDPTKEYFGNVREIDFVANRLENDEKRTKIRVLVDIDESEVEDLLRIGTGIDARIQCGKKSYFFLFTYEARDKIRELLFY